MSFIDDFLYGIGVKKPPAQDLQPIKTTDKVAQATGQPTTADKLAELVLFKNEDKYNTEILAAAKTAGIPYSIAKGLIALESAFDVRSYRFEPHINDASYGLMQILSKTARDLGYAGTNEALYDIKTNLFYGLKFLKTINAQYPIWADTIAAYNMGWPRPASATTPLIIKIYGTPTKDWTYANQPYVDRVWAYATFYQAKDVDKKYDTAKQILSDIKNKNIAGALQHGIVLTVAIGICVLAFFKGK